MTFELKISKGLSKEERYKLLLPQIDALIKDEINFIANISNITSVLKYSFDNFLWVGFYFTDNNNPGELVLGPFQGRVACTRIKFGQGVCGTSAERKETIIVNDVNEFPGHIVCDSLSKSEIVVPVLKNGKVLGVLDIDSERYGNFDETDKKFLSKMLENILNIFPDEKR
ncbi:MAG: GAF domain-containing protein [Ignavibacteria bacterium]|nr:GAF domain-containing protein [Ignavibacteria bacterium]MBK9405044.1 GAF domain-containing protein [Ignavibacteria bacterium]